MWRNWWPGRREQEEKEEERKEEGKEREEESGESRQEKGVHGGDQSVSAWVKGFENLVQSVSSYASTLTETVKTRVVESASSSIVGEFQREQEQFEKRQLQQRDAAVPPWVGYNEEEQMRAQILELSSDSRNVLRDPPPGVEFPFDYKHSAPVAMATMKEDTRLKKLRFDLVPKKVSEEVFWRNYFYRVSLIKQSLQLSSLTAAEGSTPPTPTSRPLQVHTAAATQDETDNVEKLQEAGDHDVSTEEFASDQPYNSEAVSKETVQSELNQLGVSREEEGAAEEAWEAELQADLEGLELGGEGEGLQAEDWEQELEQMLEMHSEKPTS